MDDDTGAGGGPQAPARGRRPSGDVVALVAEGFLSRLAFGLVSLALPLYALRLGMSLAAIGLLLSVNLVVQIVAKPLLAPLADRVGHRRALLLAICGRSLVCVALALATAPGQLVAARVLYGVTQALRDPPLLALIAQAGGSRRVATSFAWYHTAKNLAASVGRAVAGFLLVSTLGFRALFVVAAVISVAPVAVVAWRLGRRPGEDGTAQSPDPDAVPVAGRTIPTSDTLAPSRRRVLPLTTLGFLYGTTAGMLGLFPAMAERYLGLGTAQIGAIMLASSVVVLLAGPIFGYLTDHVGRHMVLLVRGTANVASSVLYLVLPGVWGVGTARLIDDAGKAAFRPAWGAVIADVAAQEPARRATVMTWVDVGEDTGDAVGPALAGVLLSLGGLPLMMGVRCVVAAATEVWAWRVVGGAEDGPGPTQRRTEGRVRRGARTRRGRRPPVRTG